jgi:hypothetical protein
MATGFVGIIVIAVVGAILFGAIGAGIYFATRPKDDEGGD